MDNDPRPLMPGDRVLVWDSYASDYRPGTITRRYGSETIIPDLDIHWRYPDLVDLLFDDGHERQSMFTRYVRGIND